MGIQSTNFESKAAKSIKWTIVGEVSAKLIVPITNMILARLLAPEIFGIVASVSIITNFADIISESGFSRYILQQKFSSEEKKKKSAGTANLVSVIISLLLFILVLIFNESLAKLVNADGYGMVLVLAAAQIPFYAVTNIQIALYRRDFMFGKLAIVRVLSCIIQLICSAFLALVGLGIWSIPSGSFCSILCQLLLLILMNRKALSFSFSKDSLKEMWTCSGMFLISSIVIWLDSSINTIFSGRFLGQAEAGFIKNGFTTCSGIISLFTSIYGPVFISLLAKYSYKDSEYSLVFEKYQKALSTIFIPLGIGLFVFQNFLTAILFGDGWEPASIVIGVYGLIGCIKTVSANFIISGWASQGKPWCIFVADLFSTCSLILAWILTRGLEYHIVVTIVCLAYLPATIFCICICKKTLHISPTFIIRNLLECAFPAIIMGFFGYFLRNLFETTWADAIYVFLCIVIYFAMIGFAYLDYFGPFIEVFGTKFLKKKLAQKNVFALINR